MHKVENYPAWWLFNFLLYAPKAKTLFNPLFIKRVEQGFLL
jgi:hypothetical protein